MKKKQKRIPRFSSEDQEREFWSKADTSKYFDWNKGEKALFPNLKPSTELISLRLPQYLLARIKELAHAKDIPYQSFMKMLLAERIEQELKLTRRK